MGRLHSLPMYFTDAHEELRLHIRKFLDKELQPHLQEWDEKTYPDSAFQRLGDSATSSSSTAARRSSPTAPGVTGRWSSPRASASEATRVTTCWSSKRGRPDSRSHGR